MSGSAHNSYSSPLWAHLLRKAVKPVVEDPLADLSSNSNVHPPVAPLDKPGASMRMLLHDTQANFEKFSARVDALTMVFNGAKQDVVMVKTLFEEQNEKLSIELMDLVNRCQREIQRSLGNPAQKHDLELAHKDIQSTDRRVEALDKRIDALHALHISYNQTLQALQTQQGAILTALLRVLPLHTEKHREGSMVTPIRDIGNSTSEADESTSATAKQVPAPRLANESLSSSEALHSSGSELKRRRRSSSINSTAFSSPPRPSELKRPRLNINSEKPFDELLHSNVITMRSPQPGLESVGVGPIPHQASIPQITSSLLGPCVPSSGQLKITASFSSRKTIFPVQRKPSRQPLSGNQLQHINYRHVNQGSVSSPPRGSSIVTPKPAASRNGPLATPARTLSSMKPRSGSLVMSQSKENELPRMMAIDSSKKSHPHSSPGHLTRVLFNQTPLPKGTATSKISTGSTRFCPPPTHPPLRPPSSMSHKVFEPSISRTPSRPRKRDSAGRHNPPEPYAAVPGDGSQDLTTRTPRNDLLKRGSTQVRPSPAGSSSRFRNGHETSSDYHATTSSVGAGTTLLQTGSKMNRLPQDRLNSAPSIRDRRSVTPFAAAGRRFIPLDDDDDDE